MRIGSCWPSARYMNRGREEAMDEKSCASHKQAIAVDGRLNQFKASARALSPLSLRRLKRGKACPPRCLGQNGPLTTYALRTAKYECVKLARTSVRARGQAQGGEAAAAREEKESWEV
jgi:hypothetical protein